MGFMLEFGRYRVLLHFNFSFFDSFVVGLLRLGLRYRLHLSLKCELIDCERMFELGSRLVHMYLSSGPGKPSGCGKNLSASPTGPELANINEEKIPSLQDFIQHVRRLSGVKKEDLFCNLRVPNQFQTSRQEINLIVLTGAGVYCIDVKPWRGVVSAPAPNTWHIQVKGERTELHQHVHPADP
ncbi:hypothetical protein QTP86_005022 [Hemibagrus guttatus]|nr:hypothetical protein QTP86_005022 [Hemibagrus guttatus]